MHVDAPEQLTLSDFDYDLPEALIAQQPAPRRDGSRLMTVDRATGAVGHRIFTELASCLVPGDLLVLNDTKVFPCRLAAVKAGGGKAEIFLLREKERNLWTALVKGGAGAKKSLSITPEISAEILHEHDDGTRTVAFSGIEDIRPLLQRLGRVPLPPYIKRDADDGDRERYQTVYASRDGAVAAPTAGLHFSKELLDHLSDRGVEITAVTLHVGPGTFQPVRSDNVREHRMSEERFEVSPEAARAINSAKQQGRRVIAVGTTTVRTIESAWRPGEGVRSGHGKTDLFILPGYEFHVVDGLITNFHLPKSTLLMLVSAFAGRERVLAAYGTAVEERYRFYSYGDAMCIS